MRFFTKQINPKSFGSRCVKGTEESILGFLGADSSVPLTHPDPRDLGLIWLVKKRKIRFQILSDLSIQSWISLKKRTLWEHKHTVARTCTVQERAQVQQNFFFFLCWCLPHLSRLRVRSCSCPVCPLIFTAGRFYWLYCTQCSCPFPLFVCPLLSVIRDVWFLGGECEVGNMVIPQFRWSNVFGDGRDCRRSPGITLPVRGPQRTLKWASVLHKGPTQNNRKTSNSLRANWTHFLSRTLYQVPMWMRKQTMGACL